MPSQPRTPSVRRTRLAVAAVGAVTVVAGVGLAVPSTAAAPLHADTGRVELPSNGVYSAGELEFFAGGCAEPLTQGLDTWVFELPSGVRGSGHTVTLRAGDPAFSVGAYLYEADCTLDDTAVPTGTGSTSVALDGTETWVVAFSPDPDVAVAGLDLALEVTPTVGATTTPTSTATTTVTPTATATTGPGGSRGTYGETPDDPLFLDAGGPAVLNPGQWGLRQVRAPQAWQVGRSTGFGINVAVLDSGLDLLRGTAASVHPDFACPGKVRLDDRVRADADELVADTDAVGDESAADADDDGKALPHDDVEGHGTHVAGIIGACTGNGTGIAGVAPDATLMPYQVLSAAGGADPLAAVIRSAADSGAHVINMSLGYSLAGAPGTGSAVFPLGFFEDIDAAIDYAVSKGVVVVAAAGNESLPVCGYPAIAVDVVCVGSTDARELNAWYGNFPVSPSDDEDGFGPALLAPGGAGVAAVTGCLAYVAGDFAGADEVRDADDNGEEVLSTFARDVDAEFDCDGRPGYAPLQGTSMAAPHVAGVAALVYDRFGGARSEAHGRAVVQAMLDSAKDLYAPGYDPMSGYGLVDALAAVESVEVVEPTGTPTPTTTATATPTATATATPEPLGTTTTVSAPATSQATDALALSARVVDEDGSPVSGATVAFELAGEGASLTSTAVTGPDGTATTSATPTEAGSYRATASYAGRAGTHLASSGGRDVTVTREDTTTALSTAGNGAGRTVSARVADADTASSGVAGGTVVFYDRGEEIGRATTDATGSASVAVPAGSRGSSARFGASFLGDDDFAPSTTGDAPAAAAPARTSGSLL